MILVISTAFNRHMHLSLTPSLRFFILVTRLSWVLESHYWVAFSIALSKVFHNMPCTVWRFKLQISIIIYSTHLFNKIFIFLKFFIISSLTTPLSLTNPTLPKNTQILNAQASNTCVFMYNFTFIDVGIFLLKMCKIYYFLFFAKLLTIWCGCS